MRTILMVPYRRLVLDHPRSTTSNRAARLNTTHHRLTTTRSVTIGRPERLFEVPSWPSLKAGPSNRTGKIAPKTIVTALNPHKAGQRHS
jgi:hypothetical protein